MGLRAIPWNHTVARLFLNDASTWQGNMGGIQDPIGDVLKKTEKKVLPPSPRHVDRV